MDENPGQPPLPNPPPPAAPPTYQAPPPAPPQPPAPAGPQYAAPAAAPKKRKTWLWILLGVVLVSLLACGAGVYFFVDLLAGPAKSITALNEAAADEDQDEVERYFDVESVAKNAYASFLDVILESEDGQALIEEFGSEEDARAYIEEQLPEQDFVDSLVGEFAVDGEE